MSAAIVVYADWEGLAEPRRLGVLFARRSGRGEVFEFEFDEDALADPILTVVRLDPRLGYFSGRQFPPRGRETFGIFSDSSPDRWGRVLMQRRLEREQRAGRADRSARLFESDYLLGVHDAFRVGALRYRLADGGAFLDDRHDQAAPPFVRLRELEAASLALERDQDNTSAEADAWLSMLIAPGGSLGGARPKASVVDPDGHLWIAKFPSIRDDVNVGAWELAVQALARGCGLRVPQAEARRFASEHHTFLIRRFDRTAAGERLHFASGLTLTDRADGDDAATGASYLELAEVLITHGSRTEEDLRELWSRVAFNVLVSNSDDHLRNHGFILEPRKGWRLSEAYDVNPAPGSTGLRLNISEADNAMDLELVRSVAPYFRVKGDEASRALERFRAVVRRWRTVADRLGLPPREQDRMADAFRLAG